MIAGRILAQAAVLAVCVLAIAAFFRFQIIAAGTAGGALVYRLDRLTGTVTVCVPKGFPQYVCE